MIKKIVKIIVLVFVGFLLLEIGVWVGMRGYDYYKSWPVRKFAKGVEQMQKERDLLYKNDVYGGKTPEETFDMYIAALKKGDLDLASKYFVISGQQKELSTLKKLGKTEFVKYLNDIDGVTNVWKLDEGGSSNIIKIYRVPNKSLIIHFSYNEAAKIWKIDFL